MFTTFTVYCSVQAPDISNTHVAQAANTLRYVNSYWEQKGNLFLTVERSNFVGCIENCKTAILKLNENEVISPCMRFSVTNVM